MADIRVRVALKRRPHTQALFDGTVKPSGLRFEAIDVKGTEERRRMMMAGELDAVDVGISKLVLDRSQGLPWIGIPAYVKRGFVHGSIYCRETSAALGPEALEGKRVGVEQYHTISIWLLGLLQQEYGVDLSKIEWLYTGPPTIKHAALLRSTKIDVPSDFQSVPDVSADDLFGEWGMSGGTELGRQARYLVRMLLDGAIDAAIFTCGLKGAGIRPVIESPVAEVDYLRRTGVYPILHLISIREDLVATHPCLATSLLEAFRAAREFAPKYLEDWQRLRSEEEDSLTGGIDPYHHLLGPAERQIVDTFQDHLIAHGAIGRKMALQELFAEETIGR